jgi:WD40 repeat protein
MNGHTGWVRSLASSGKYLFSCGCNYLRQWDQAYAVPKEVSSTKLFTGDILAIACADKQVFTAGADGSLRSWSIGKLGELTVGVVREKAHDGRITALLVHGSLIYSAGYDGSIKVRVDWLSCVCVSGHHGMNCLQHHCASHSCFWALAPHLMLYVAAASAALL